MEFELVSPLFSTRNSAPFFHGDCIDIGPSLQSFGIANHRYNKSHMSNLKT